VPPPKIVQIEVTTACQLQCVFCPRTVLADRWINDNFSWETFSSMLPALRKVEQVHLQGWGEPLLHPRIWDMAAAIKKKRVRVSLTTNAMLLDEVASQEACRTGVDIVAVSVAGARAETHDSLRIGSSLDQICSNISYLCQLKPRPRVHLVMQMMKPNLEELPELVTLAANLRVDEVIAPNLDYIPDEKIDDLKVFIFSTEPRHNELINETHRKGEELGVIVHTYPLTGGDDVLVCDADPLHNVCITARGEVTPCVYVAPPLQGNIPRIFRGETETFPRLSFGSVTEGLDNALNGQEARSFRQAFAQRLQVDTLDAITDRVPSLLSPRSTLAGFLRPLTRMTSPTKSATLLPPPDLCQKCYKFYGF